MSGGFFRGTSADQDTRFSNKQAKLLKSQKFAPELDQLVDMTKVKMDVIRPWIATRATQLLGFEDEVLINFVYGLLDVKEVDGKQIQIQLTGFMEKNTGKFMKELWSLLLSAQKNASGVPQQFLDAKEEEARKKKVETDRITQEIQRKKETEKEGRELEREKQNKMDGEADISRFTNTASDALPKHSVPRASSVHPEIEREVDERHRSRTKNGSSHSSDHSPLSHRNTASRTRSSSKSFSKSRSYSEEGHKSGSVSVSSRSERHSISPKRRYRSPPRQSISPKRRYQSPRRRSISPRRKRSPRNPWSPSRRRQPRSKQRSHSRHRSPSPRRWRSPHARRRSPSLRRKSPSPLRHRSPSPLRRKSPVQVRRRSPSPSRQRSLKRRSLSPARRNSPSPLRRRSPPPRSPKYRRRSPLHSPRRRATDSQISPLRRKRSRSPYGSQSPSYRSRRSVSREHDSRINGVDSRRYRDACASHRAREKRSPGRTNLRRRGSDSVSRQLPISLRSPQRDLRDRSDINKREPVSLVQQEKTQNLSESPSHVQEMSPKENRRSPSLSENRMTRHDSPETSRDEEQSNRAREDVRHQTDSSCKESKHSRVDVGLKKTHANDFNPKVHSLDRLSAKQYATTRGHRVDIERREDREMSDMDLPERNIHQASNSSEEIEYGPGGVGQERLSLDNVFDEQPSVKKLSGVASSVERQCNEQALKGSYREGYRVDNMKHRQLISDECGETYHEMVSVQKSKKKVDQSNRTDHVDSASEGNNTDRRYRNTEKQRHKKPDHQKRDWDEVGEYDAQVVDRKEAKRRRKDEKRLRKEESRRRREERHRRRLERRAGKLNAESMDTVTPPSDFEKNYSSADESDGDVSTRKDSHPSETEEMESEQKKLEIELRKKALESLRAKKAISP